MGLRTFACVAALIAASSSLSLSVLAQDDPGVVRLLIDDAAVIHTVSGGALFNTDLFVEDGKIAILGQVDLATLALPAGRNLASMKSIREHGIHIYPALIEGISTLGLDEVGAVRATRDTSEVGRFNPNARADIAFHPDSALLGPSTSQGILVAFTAPRGGLVSGQGALMVLDGWTREDMSVCAPCGLLVDWPNMTIDRSSERAKKLEERRDDNLRELTEYFATARAYAAARASSNPPPKDVKWDAMLPYLDGTLPVVVRADKAAEIRAALKWAGEQKLRMVIAGGADAWRLADEIAKARVPVIYTGIVNVPRRDTEDYDTYYKAPGILEKAGVKVAIAYGGEPGHTRNLPDFAGRAAAYGMTPEGALRAITLTPAEIFGVDKRLGSIEVGKDATFIVTDGDILDTRTHILRAFIQGREVDLNDRQKQLWKKYMARPQARTAPKNTPN